MGSVNGPIAEGGMRERPKDQPPLAVLISGGLDSAILLGEALRSQPAVHPLYVRSGLYWEEAEQDYLRRFLDRVRCPVLQPLQVLSLPVADLYGAHWSMTGDAVPDAASPDAAVFLPGRNILLLAKAMLWCHLQAVPALALAPLHQNPFSDATPAFFGAYQDAVNQGLGSSVQVRRPYAELSKAEVMQRGRDLPLELTFSCIRPTAGRHCGRCNKCAERRRAFADAGMSDRTEYGAASLRTGDPLEEERCTG
jgi:7-cyano-7-deazaguanine synthase